MSAPRVGGQVLASAGPTMSIRELAEVLGISTEHAYALAAKDELGVRILRLGRTMRIPTADVRRLVGADAPMDDDA